MENERISACYHDISMRTSPVILNESQLYQAFQWEEVLRQEGKLTLLAFAEKLHEMRRPETTASSF